MTGPTRQTPVVVYPRRFGVYRVRVLTPKGKTRTRYALTFQRAMSRAAKAGSDLRL